MTNCERLGILKDMSCGFSDDSILKRYPNITSDQLHEVKVEFERDFMKKDKPKLNSGAVF